MSRTVIRSTLKRFRRVWRGLDDAQPGDAAEDVPGHLVHAARVRAVLGGGNLASALIVSCPHCAAGVATECVRTYELRPDYEDYMTYPMWLEWGTYGVGRKWQRTGRMIWCDASASGCFTSHTVHEINNNREAPFGAQAGTYWKTARLHDGTMPVWTWGGMTELERFIVRVRQRECTHEASLEVLAEDPCEACSRIACLRWAER